MKHRFYLSIYALTLLISAALLFAVQPMFSKMILPLLGGTPQVWNTAMVFFQLTLLAGYAYAHGTTKFFGVRSQAVLHVILLCIFAFILPIALPDGWSPPVDRDPTWWQLSLMAITVGGPFFILAASAPMFQRWFASTGHPDAGNPYFLYGASNLGSMTSLFAYPVIIEPFMTTEMQSMSWSFGYGLLIIFTIICAALVWPHVQHSTEKQPKKTTSGAITWKRRLLWIALAAIPSSLMLGVTTYITTDVASAPLLWILPLALYVGTFIIVFARRTIIAKKHVFLIQTVLMCFLILQTTGAPLPINTLLFIHFSLFFFSALACHMELADSKPPAENLTEFYLLMSLGGAIGGIMNAIIAPQFFIIPYEYAIALGGSFVVCSLAQKQPFPRKLTFEVGTALGVFVFAVLIFHAEVVSTAQLYTKFLILFLVLTVANRWALTASICLCLLLFPPGHYAQDINKFPIIHLDRNFFGVLKVVDAGDEGRLFMHGTTLHGVQHPQDEYRLIPSSYYGKDSSISNILDLTDKTTERVAVLGLGIGVLACLDKPGRSYDFYEINSKVVEIAENPEYFTYLSDCGSPYEIILGDARLTIEKMPDDHYDVIVMDTFSSDNIPAHLMTTEALELYMQKLKDDGILAIHISNRHLDLEPVLAAAAENMGIKSLARLSLGSKVEGTPIEYFDAHVVILTKNQSYIGKLEKLKWSSSRKRDGVKFWTDEYSNIISVIGNKIGNERDQELRAEIAKMKAELEKPEESSNSGTVDNTTNE